MELMVFMRGKKTILRPHRLLIMKLMDIHGKGNILKLMKILERMNSPN